MGSGAEQREQLLYLLGRMRQMQAASDLQRVPNCEPLGFKRPAEEQPLDFSGKNPRLSPVWPPTYPDNKHDSLGSDGHSVTSDTSSHSPGSQSEESGREPLPGSASPPRPALPALSIPSLASPKGKVTARSDLLTTVPRFPALKPLSALQMPAQDMNPLLGLAGLAAAKPSQPNPVNLPLPFTNFPLFPQNLSSAPFPFQPQPPKQEPLDQLTKISMDSQEKYAEFRDTMMKNIETTRSKPRKAETGESPGTPSTALNDSLDMPDCHSTPQTARDGKDAAYWERRRKNNEAAKRSRDARRQKENEIAVRASYLEQENIQLKMELVQLRTELGSVKDQLGRRPLQSC